MGAEPAQIRREIAEQRRRMTPRMAELGERLQADVQEARGVARERLAQVRSAADRGIALIAGAFFVGLVLGFMVQGRRKSKERDKLLQEAIKAWPWRSEYVGGGRYQQSPFLRPGER